MTHRERFIKTLKGELTDRPPLYVSIVPQLAKRVSDNFIFFKKQINCSTSEQ